MPHVHVNVDSSLTYPYNRDMLVADYPDTSFPMDILTNPSYVSVLPDYNVFPVVDNPPVDGVNYDSSVEQVIVGDVVFQSPDYVQMYSIVPYTLPSILDGGTRHPTSLELDAADQSVALVYWRKNVEKMIRDVAASLEFGEYQNVRGQDVFVGNWNNALAYTQDPTHFLYQRAIDFITYRGQVWDVANATLTQWLTSVIAAPTRDDLFALFPTAPVLATYQP